MWSKGSTSDSPQEVSQPIEASQQLTVAITTDVETWYLNNFPDGDTRFVWAQVYETLVRLTPDLQLTEGMAVRNGAQRQPQLAAPQWAPGAARGAALLR